MGAGDLRGYLVDLQRRGLKDTSQHAAARALTAAVVLRSLRDAAAGDPEAALWLDDPLIHEIGLTLGVRLAGWRDVTPPVHVARVARGRLVSSAERSRDYRRKQKHGDGVG